MLRANELYFFVPFEVDLSKSQSKCEERRIRGYASTPDKDRQNEQLVQKGLDISDFVDFGWFNYDHDNSIIIGYPDKDNTRIDSHGFYVEGELLKGVEMADKVWDTAVALQKSNAPRRMGFSVEGKVLERGQDGKILKAKVYNVAITPNPINPKSTWDAIVKSFAEGAEIIGASAGYSTVVGDENSGGVLKKESLEDSLKNLSYLIGSDHVAQMKLRELRDCLNCRQLTKAEAIVYLQISKGLSRLQAEKVCDQYYKNN